MTKKVDPLPQKFPRKQKEGPGMDWDNLAFPKPPKTKKRKRK